jgi:hypothetical protein
MFQIAAADGVTILILWSESSSGIVVELIGFVRFNQAGMSTIYLLTVAEPYRYCPYSCAYFIPLLDLE